MLHVNGDCIYDLHTTTVSYTGGAGMHQGIRWTCSPSSSTPWTRRSLHGHSIRGTAQTRLCILSGVLAWWSLVHSCTAMALSCSLLMTTSHTDHVLFVMFCAVFWSPCGPSASDVGLRFRSTWSCSLTTPRPKQRTPTSRCSLHIWYPSISLQPLTCSS